MAAHNPKINIWAGISRNGPTKLIIFKGNLKGPGYVKNFASWSSTSFKKISSPNVLIWTFRNILRIKVQ